MCINVLVDSITYVLPNISSASGRIIGAKDHASVQLNIADVSTLCLFLYSHTHLLYHSITNNGIVLHTHTHTHTHAGG